MNRQRQILAVLGAGPKGIAVAIKAKVLEEMGLPVDKVILIERHSVGAHWSGEAGYTDGEMRLGTSPEKDVVFPLETTVGDSELDKRIKQRLLTFTWVSYLIDKGEYSDWVDRGKPAPRHSEWSAYLKWVSRELAPEVTVIKAELEHVDLTSAGDKWSLSLKVNGGLFPYTLEADRLMLTGPGKTKISFEGGHDLESFWKSIKEKTFHPRGKIAVVGAGENAASILLALSKLKERPEIEVISPKGFIATRAENYYENQFYSRPLEKGWKKLTLKDRKDFIGRTDLGVFSVEAMKLLNGEKNHQIIPGRVMGLKAEAEGLTLELEYGGERFKRSYGEVIFATGHDFEASLQELFTERALKFLNGDLALRIQDDLSVAGVKPLLHLPMLAGLSQGPGFSNLSCLGLLSDRVMVLPMLMKNELPLEVMEVS